MIEEPEQVEFELGDAPGASGDDEPEGPDDDEGEGEDHGRLRNKCMYGLSGSADHRDNKFRENAKCENFVKTISVIAATIICSKDLVQFSALIAQYLKFYYVTLISLAIFLSFCSSMYDHPNPASHEPANYKKEFFRLISVFFRKILY